VEKEMQEARRGRRKKERTRIFVTQEGVQV
jgi:hypothetical protein